MDQLNLTNYLIMGAGAVVAGFVKVLWGKVEKLETNQRNTDLHLAANYVPRSEIEAKLDKILNAVDELRKSK